MILLFQLLHAIILWFLEFAPYPELFVYPYLTHSGFLPYRDILDQHFPGLMFFPVNLFTIGFHNPISLKLMLIIVVLTTSAWIYKISKSSWAVLIYTLWQPFFEGTTLWLDIFLPVFLLPAFYFFIHESWFLAGLSLGLGLIVKQTILPLILFAGLVLISKKNFPNLIKFSLGAIFPLGLTLIYFSHIHVLGDFWFWAVKFNLSTFASGGRLSPRAVDLLELSLPVLTLVYVYLKIPSSRVFIHWLVFSIIGGIARFGFIHLQPAIPFFVLAVSQLTSRRSALVLFLVGTLIWQGYFYSHQKNWGGYKYFDQVTLTLVSKITSKALPGDKIFLLGVDPHIYALTHTLPPGNTFVFQFPWFLQIAGQRILSTLQTDPPKLIIYDPESITDGRYLRDYANYLVDYTQKHYIQIDQVDHVLIYAQCNNHC